MHLVMIGGSDAGISAALRARELDPGAEVSVVVADAYPNFSICGIPYYVSGEVTHWRNLAHRTTADLEATGMNLRLDTAARRIDVSGRKLLVTGPKGHEELLAYDKLVIGTGAVPVRPPIGGLEVLGPDDGVHLLHSMGDTFAVMRTLEDKVPASAVVVGAGYIGLEMADALTTRGLHVIQMEQLPEVLPTVDPALGHLVHAQLADRGVGLLSRQSPHHDAVHRRPRHRAAPRRAAVRAPARRDRQAHRHRRHRHLPRHDRRRAQRPGPVLYAPPRQPLGRHPDRRPSLAPRNRAALTHLTSAEENHASQRRTASPHHSPRVRRHPQCMHCCDHRPHPDQATGQALVTMLAWLTHDGQAYATANLYVPLPAQVRQLAHTMLGQVTGPGRTHLFG